jgi:hypothetical protein
MHPMWEARFRADHGQCGSHAFGTTTEKAGFAPITYMGLVQIAEARFQRWRNSMGRISNGKRPPDFRRPVPFPSMPWYASVERGAVDPILSYRLIAIGSIIVW